MTEFTPGPWYVGKWFDEANGVAILSIANSLVAVSKYLGGTAQAKTNARLIAAAPDTAAERDRLQKLIIDFQEWCRVERGALGAIDGYDYDSGQEYGLRRAEIAIGQLNVLAKAKESAS